MPMAAKELIALDSPTSFSMEENDIFVIKGFTSVETLDRSGDLTDPLEFNIDTFMAAPTLMYNHTYWNEYGNNVTIGRPLTMHAAKLAKLEGDDSNWAIVDLKTKQQVNIFPKEKVPELKAGDRGLFVTCQVTQPAVQEMIKRGEISGLSWRGLTEVGWELAPDNSVVRVLKDIDLYEVSVVNVPNHNQSTLIIGKSGDGLVRLEEELNAKNFQLWQVRLEKTNFASLEATQEFLKKHRLDDTQIRQDEFSYFALQQDSNNFDLTKVVRVKMGDVYMLLAPRKSVPERNIGNRLVAELVDVVKSGLLSLSEVKAMSVESGKASQPAVTPETGKVEAVKGVENTAGATTPATPAVTETANPPPKEEATKGAEQLQLLGDHIAKVVVAGLQPMFNTLSTSFEKAGAAMTQLVEKMAVVKTPSESTNTNTEPKTETRTEVAKSMDLGVMFEKLNRMAESLDIQQRQLVEVAKSALEIVPNSGEVRNEKVVVEKSATTEEDPNAVFDSAFPFLK